MANDTMVFIISTFWLIAKTTCEITNYKDGFTNLFDY